MSEDQKLSSVADAGHMGLFRSRRVFRDHYGHIAGFMKANSDYAEGNRYMGKLARRA
ncbi:MAG: hypothetical protein U5L07_19515 [Desulfobacterales bacterium]|nr:hypothetical protein [Desulfobacterales bacterium]